MVHRITAGVAVANAVANGVAVAVGDNGQQDYQRVLFFSPREIADKKRALEGKAMRQVRERKKRELEEEREREGKGGRSCK